VNALITAWNALPQVAGSENDTNPDVPSKEILEDLEAALEWLR
jgi:hypothetical protein